MKKLLLSAMAGFLLPSAAFAQCMGTANFKTCYDGSGNSYSISRFGNSTIVNGSNTRTGSTWSQQSNRLGNTTITNGTDSNGRSWNSTSTPYATYGTDADGKSFYEPN